MNRKPIILVGGGGHCKSCIDVIESVEKYRIEGILDIAERQGGEILGYPIIGDDTMIESLIIKKVQFLITVGDIGNPEKRIQLFNMVSSKGGHFPVIISPFACVSQHATIQQGTIIMHHATVNASATIGQNCIINSMALIEHDARIGDHCHISTGAIINGGTIVGSASFIGSGSVTRQYISIENNSFIKANSTVK